MKKARLICLFIIISLLVNIKVSDSQGFPLDFPSTSVQSVAQKFTEGPTTPLNQIAERAGERITGETGTVPSLTPTTTVENAISPVTGLQGSSLLKVDGLLIEGSALKSVIDSNFVPFYNLVDGSIVAFDLNKDQLVSVQQFINGKIGSEFKTTLSKGAKLRQFFRNSDTVISFEATDDASFFIRKDKQYEFEHGILTFRNNNIIEKITTKDKTKATIDSDLGATMLTLGKNASYSYENVENPEINLFLENHGNNGYLLMIKKLSNAQANGNYIDFPANRIELEGLITLKKKVKGTFKVFYESFNEKNKIKIDLSENNAVLTNVFLDAKGTGMIANIYNGLYKITEKNVNIYKRLATFYEESPLILRYASSLDNKRVITVDQKTKLTQEKQNKVVLIAKRSLAYQKCSESLKTFMRYKDKSFLEEC